MSTLNESINPSLLPTSRSTSFALIFCPAQQWRGLVACCFRGDAQLLATYHVAAPCDLATAVADTCLALREEVVADLVLYGVYAGTQAVGMVGVEPGSNWLVTFGLGIAHRNRENARQLAGLCRGLLDPTRPAFCALYEKNIPARAFVRRLGFEPSPELLLHPVNKQAGILYTLNKTQ